MEKKTNPRRKKKSSPTAEKTLSDAYPTDLKDRKSVRTTFKISKKSAETIKVLARHHGVSFKEVFDNLSTRFQKERLFKKIASESELYEAPFLQQIAHMAEGFVDEYPDKYANYKENFVRKSQVVSRGALRTLNEVSKEYQIPRDLLVNWALTIMGDKFEKDIVTTREKYQEAYEIIAELNSHASNAAQQLYDLLDEDDPILLRFASVGAPLEDLCSAIKANLDDDTPIDPDDFGQSG